jgi:predicted nucleotidyltransferase
VLRRLTEHGLVDWTEVGSAHLHVLNRDHVAAPAVLLLRDLREELLRRLREAIAAWTVRPLNATLFGSAARGDGGPSSDIDLLVVRPEVDEHDQRWSNQVDDLARSVRRWTGNHAAIAEMHAKELERLRIERPPIVDQLIRDGVMLFGAPVRNLLGEGAGE